MRYLLVIDDNTFPMNELKKHHREQRTTGHHRPDSGVSRCDVDMNRASAPHLHAAGRSERTGCAIFDWAPEQSRRNAEAPAPYRVMFIGTRPHHAHLRKVLFFWRYSGGTSAGDVTADEMLSGIEPQRETKTQQAKDLSLPEESRCSARTSTRRLWKGASPVEPSGMPSGNWAMP